MTPEEIQALMQGIIDLKGAVEPLGSRIKTLEESHAKTEQRFLEWQKRGLTVLTEQRTKRGLGSHRLNEVFGKALIQLARGGGYLEDVFCKAAGITDTYLVNTEVAGEIIRLVEERGVIRQIASRIPMGAGTTTWPRRLTGSTASFVAAASSVSPSNPTFGQVSLAAATAMALALVQNASLEDSVADLGAFVAEELAYGFASLEDLSAISGDSSATYGGCYGLLSSQLAALTANCPTPVVFDSGKTAFSDLTFNNLMSCVDAIKSQALPGARWLMHRSIVTLVRQIVDSNKRYIWLPDGGAQGNPSTLLGFPITVCDQMPAITATGAAVLFIVFGNFKYWYFGDRRQVSLVADASRYREYDQTGFFATERIAQQLADGGAFATLSTHA